MRTACCGTAWGLGGIEARLDVLEADMKDVKKRLSNIEGAFYEEFHPLLLLKMIANVRTMQYNCSGEEGIIWRKHQIYM